MDPTTPAPQVETGAPSANPTPDPVPNTGAVTAPTPVASNDDPYGDNEFDAYYQDRDNPVASTVEPTEGTTGTGEVPAGTTTDDTTPAAQVPGGDIDLNNLPDKLRARFSDPEDIAIATLARAKGISLSKATALYHEQQPAVPATAATIPGVDNATPEPSAVQTLQGQVDALTGEIEAAEANEDYLSPEYARNVRKLSALQADLRVAKFEEQQQTQTRQQREAQARDAQSEHALATAQEENRLEVIKAYPALAVADSPLRKAANAIAAEWLADPKQVDKLRAPNAPELILAKALLRAPQVQTAPPAAPVAPATPKPPVVAPPVAARRPAPTASGSQSSAASAQPTASNLGVRIAAATTSEEIDRVFDDAYEDDGIPSLGSRR